MRGLIEFGGVEVSAIDAILYVWFVLAGLSTAYVAWDNFVNKNPEETVMKWGWVLITFYMGPVALALYVLTDKESRSVVALALSHTLGTSRFPRR